MSITSGQMLSHYRLVEKLGEGGMGVVWRAVDTRLGRDVALKTLPDHVAADPDRLGRFEREARALASLNHPNIAAIYGVEHRPDGPPVLVLELVPGEGLDARIRRGPMPLPEALDLAVQFATGLEAAHELGVVHRDLKPANVKITPAGQLKILDFGLAKVAAAMSGPNSGEPDITASPTVTSVPTRVGAFLGTVGYMSPEQARGRTVDRRADIWAFGCIVFECLAGRQPFAGETPAEKIGALLHLEPAWEALPPDTPAALEDLLRRCLVKDPRERLRDIGDARLALLELRARPDAPVRRVFAPAPPPRRRRALGWALAAAALVALAVPAALLARRDPAPAAPAWRVAVPLPPRIQVADLSLPQDGSTLLLRLVPLGDEGQQPDKAQVWTRRLDSFELTPVPGSEGARGSGFSGDGSWLGFIRPVTPDGKDARFWRMPIDGRTPPVAVAAWRANWRDAASLDRDELIVLTDEGTTFVRLSAAGEVLHEARRIDTGGAQASFHTPAGLPDRRYALLCASLYTPRGFSIGTAVLDLETGRARLLLEDGGNTKYSPTGHLVFTRGSTLLAAPFDTGRMTLTGAPVALLGGLRTENPWTPADFALGGGHLAFVPGTAPTISRHLVRLGPDGRRIPWTSDPRAFEFAPVPSHDGRRIAQVILTPSALYEIWVSGVDRPDFTRVVGGEPADLYMPSWSPDDTRLAYLRVARDAHDGVYVLDLASGRARRVLSEIAYPVAWTPEGALVVHGQGGMRRLAVTGDARPEPFTVAGQKPTDVAFSADGRRVAFSGDGSGRHEVYVADWNAGRPGPAVRVSSKGGRAPSWAPDGRALWFVEEPGRRLAGVRIGARGPDGSLPGGIELPRGHAGKANEGPAVLADGSILALERGPEEQESGHVNVILNFERLLRERVQ